MRYDAEIALLATVYSADELGQEVATVTSRTIPANEYTLSSAEFYDAGRAGLKPEREYQVRSCDYGGETMLEADGVQYEVIRTERRGEWTRLVCQRKVGSLAEGLIS